MHPISVIVPCYNEAENIERTLRRAIETSVLKDLPSFFVIDAGNEGRATEAAVARLKGIHSNVISNIRLQRPSRGAQLICGAKMTTTPFLLFLHADTLLPTGWDQEIVEFFEARKNVRPLLGCFELSLPPPISSSLAIMLCVANLRAKLAHLPYGDQAYFVRRDEYESVGGFANVPLMEDVDLLQRYKTRARREHVKDAAHKLPRQKGLASSLQQIYESYCYPSCIQVLPVAVMTSPRRWNRKGVWWNTLCNQFYMLAWMAGVSSATIYRWYYGKSVKVE